MENGNEIISAPKELQLAHWSKLAEQATLRDSRCRWRLRTNAHDGQEKKKAQELCEESREDEGFSRPFS
ncbi:UNVERIFIED_CONTAM: hypothetical protein K2H54_008414 [Gekko kuhli]